MKHCSSARQKFRRTPRRYFLDEKTVADISPLLYFVIIVLCTKSVSLKSRGSVFSSLFLACLRPGRCGGRYILRASDINQSPRPHFCAVGSRDFQEETPSFLRLLLLLPPTTCSHRARVSVKKKSQRNFGADAYLARARH